VGTAAFLLVWSVAALSGMTSRNFLPAPWDVVTRFVELVVEPFAGFTLFEHLLSSFRRFAAGFALAGHGEGLASGLADRLDDGWPGRAVRAAGQHAPVIAAKKLKLDGRTAGVEDQDLHDGWADRGMR
jgi:hypothetical protein